MIEQTLNKAIEIKNRLDKAREIQKNTEEKRNLCAGNTSEVATRSFKLSITNGTNIREIHISSRAAYEALDIDFRNASKVVDIIEIELDQLN